MMTDIKLIRGFTYGKVLNPFKDGEKWTRKSAPF